MGECTAIGEVQTLFFATAEKCQQVFWWRYIKSQLLQSYSCARKKNQMDVSLCCINNIILLFILCS